MFQLNWIGTFLKKRHHFTFSRFTTRKTTSHTRNLKPATPTVRGGLGMRWQREPGIFIFINVVNKVVVVHDGEGRGGGGG